MMKRKPILPKPNSRASSILKIDGVLLSLILCCIFLIPAPGKVSGFRVDSSTYNSVSLTWDAAENASGYSIYRAEAGKDYSYLATTNKTEYTDRRLITGKRYTYAIKPKNGVKSRALDESQPVPAEPKLEAPELKADQSEGEVRLSFSKVDGATGYEVYRGKKKIATQKETTFVDEEATNDRTYRYTVKAYRYVKRVKKPVFSESSNEVDLKVLPVSPIEAELQGEDILLSWEASDTYAKYMLYDGEELLAETEETEYRIEDFDPDKQYDISLAGISADEDLRSPESVLRFIIEKKPMDNEAARQAACDWAQMIADDDSFTYGAGERAHRYGCYFCGTNTGPVMEKKGTSLVDGHSYEKTYCCNPFITAIYAHGAGDPAQLEACRSGSGVAMSEKSFTKYGNWENAGHPPMSKLEKGDVLVKPTHVAMYMGDGMFVEASTKDWAPESIAVKPLTEKRYDIFEFVMRYTGNGRGYSYSICELSDVDRSGQ